MMLSPDSLTTTCLGTIVTICDGTTTLLKGGPVETPSFVIDLIPDPSSVSKLISASPDKASKSISVSDALSSGNLRRTLLDLPIEGT